MPKIDTKIIECPICGEEKCLEEIIGDETWYLCKGCGYYTSSTLTENCKMIKNVLRDSPEVIKENAVVENGLVWLLTVISNKNFILTPKKFADSFKWTYIPVLREADIQGPDITNSKLFDSFSEAIEYIDSLFENNT